MEPSYKMYIRRSEVASIRELGNRAIEFEAIRDEQQKRRAKISVRAPRQEEPNNARLNALDCSHRTVAGYLSRPQVRCWRCGEENHSRRTCRRSVRLFCSRCGKLGVRSVDCQCPGNARFRVPCSFPRCDAPGRNDNRIWKKVQICQQKVHALIDTGATTSFMSDKLYAHLEREGVPSPVPTRTQVRMANGSTIQPIGVVTVPIQIEGSWCRASFTIVPSSIHEVIIGMDVMREMEAEINTASGMVTFRKTDEWFGIAGKIVPVVRGDTQPRQSVPVPQTRGSNSPASRRPTGSRSEKLQSTNDTRRPRGRKDAGGSRPDARLYQSTTGIAPAGTGEGPSVGAAIPPIHGLTEHGGIPGRLPTSPGAAQPTQPRHPYGLRGRGYSPTGYLPTTGRKPDSCVTSRAEETDAYPPMGAAPSCEYRTALATRQVTEGGSHPPVGAVPYPGKQTACACGTEGCHQGVRRRPHSQAASPIPMGTTRGSRTPGSWNKSDRVPETADQSVPRRSLQLREDSAGASSPTVAMGTPDRVRV